MKFQLATKPLSEVNAEYLVLPVFEGGKSQFNGSVSDFLSDNPKFGNLYDFQLLYSKNKKLLLIGAGKKEKLKFETLQNWVGTAIKQLASKTKTASIFVPETENLSSEEIAKATVIGAEIAVFNPAEEFKSEKESPILSTLEILVSKAERGYQTGIKDGLVIAESINLVRQLGDKPPNIMTPSYFLNTATKLAKENKLKLTVLDEKQATKKGMGAFAGVAKGSDEPSFMIALEYNGDLRSKEKWGLVGKGITFDTGGLNIKTERHMSEMHYDMCGAAAVLAAITAIAKLDLKTNIVAVMAVTENFPSGKAQRPGDIVKTYSGKTAEVANTDAEGRLVLVDALSFAQKDFKATKLIDLATLTGAIISALGDFYTGAFGNNSNLTQKLIDSGKKTGEKIWELPMDEEFNEIVKSDVADLYNLSKGGSTPGAAGSIAGAKFIEAVIEDNHPWVHLDIAGSATDMKPKPYRALGATGVGVKTLIQLISEG